MPVDLPKVPTGIEGLDEITEGGLPRGRATLVVGSPGAERFLFRLYIAGASVHSARARENLQALCREHLPDRHEIEVIDVLRAPRRALQDGILVTPTLLKLSPEPADRIIGDLARTADVLSALGLAARPR